MRTPESQRFLLARPSIADRMAAGKKLRERFPRSDHALYRPSRRRRDPLEILGEQEATRLPQLVPIRHSRMVRSPFAYLRGAAAVMAADLRRTPVTGLSVQACGDMHVANFGFFASAERNLVFGINDFDETLRGPWEWDLKRLAASAAVAVRAFGGDQALCAESARSAVAAYRVRMREFAELGHLQLWYSRIDERDVLAALTPRVRERAERLLRKARKRTHLQVLEKMTSIVDSRKRIVEHRPLIVRETHVSDGMPVLEGLERVLESYLPTLSFDRSYLLSKYRVVDVARKVVGVGSVGTRCWVIFLEGNHGEDPLFLQVKQAQPSVLASYGGLEARGGNAGARVVEGQRLIQGAPDIFLGWGEALGIQFYVRQLRDMKGGAEFDPSTTEIESAPEYLGLCGWALALAHAKGGDAAAIAGYLGNSEAFDDAVARFALAYAEQTARDHEALVQAARAGRITLADGNP